MIIKRIVNGQVSFMRSMNMAPTHVFLGRQEYQQLQAVRMAHYSVPELAMMDDEVSGLVVQQVAVENYFAVGVVK